MIRILKRYFSLFLLFITLQSAARHLQDPGMQQPATSLLWKISGNGLSAPSYLFGTFHIMCKTDFSIGPKLDSILRLTQQLYGELDMDDPSVQLQLLAGMRLTNTTLTNLMGKEAFDSASETFKQLTGLPLSMFDQFSPFMPISMLAINSMPCKDNVQPETLFSEWAKQHKLPVLGLETVQDQINAVNAQPLDSQAMALTKTLHNFDSVKISMRDMMAEYKKNDPEAVYRFIKENSTDNGDFETRMLTQRNQNWIPVIRKAITAKPSFIAVGAGHLGGSNGVLALLRQAGYELTPVSY